MTEVGVGSAEQYVENNPASQPVNGGAGQLLRQAREEQHMSEEAMAFALKVSVYKLQALEEERWDILTDSVFARALALSICRLLRIPSEPVLAGMPKHTAAKLASNPEGINAPYKEKSLRSLMASSSDSQAGSASKVVALVLVAVAVGAGLYFLPHWDATQDADTAASSMVLPGDSAEEPLFMPPLLTAPEAPSAEQQPQGESVAVQPGANVAPAASVPLMAPAMPETPVAPLALVAGAASQPAVAAPAGGRALRFAASGETWVQVRDAQQRVLMEKILKSGDVYESTLAAHPLQVVVGNASVTKLDIDGAAWDLAASAKNNVARFEVK